MRRRVARWPLAQPRLDRGVGDRSAPSPQTTRRDLDEGDSGPDGLFQRETVAVRPSRQQMITERLERARLLVDERATHRDDLDLVDAFQPAAELTLLDPVHDRLHERAQVPCIAGGDEMDRPAHQREPDDRAVEESRRELLRVERDDPAPEPRVGGVRRLCLHADELLKDVLDRSARPFEQELASQCRSIDLAQTQDATDGSVG